MTKKDFATLQEIREIMLNAKHAAEDEQKRTNNEQDKNYWNGQIVAYRDILRQLQKFPTPIEFLSSEILAIYNS